MRSQFGASLNVSSKSALNEEEVLLYNLIGYHGDTWFKGQVSWMAEGDSKVYIILVTSFSVTTPNLDTTLYYQIDAKRTGTGIDKTSDSDVNTSSSF